VRGESVAQAMGAQVLPQSTPPQFGFQDPVHRPGCQPAP
jgi:hypothetical protein